MQAALMSVAPGRPLGQGDQTVNLDGAHEQVVILYVIDVYRMRETSIVVPDRRSSQQNMLDR